MDGGMGRMRGVADGWEGGREARARVRPSGGAGDREGGDAGGGLKLRLGKCVLGGGERRGKVEGETEVVLCSALTVPAAAMGGGALG